MIERVWVIRPRDQVLTAHLLTGDPPIHDGTQKSLCGARSRRWTPITEAASSATYDICIVCHARRNNAERGARRRKPQQEAS